MTIQATYATETTQARDVRYGDIWHGAMVRQVERPRSGQVWLHTGPDRVVALACTTPITVERRVHVRAKVATCPKCGAGPSLVYLTVEGDACAYCDGKRRMAEAAAEAAADVPS